MTPRLCALAGAVLCALAWFSCVRAENNIAISIDLGSKKADASGSDSSVIIETERNSFDLVDYQLKRLVRKEFGKKPDDAFVRGPTMWGDLYKRFNWKAVERTLKVSTVEMLGSTDETIVLESKAFVNNATFPVKRGVVFFKQVLNTVTHTWNKTGEVSGAIQLNYNLKFPLGANGASVLMSYMGNWGKSKTLYRPLSVGDISELEFEVPAGSTATARLAVSRRDTVVHVDYVAGLTGDVVINYGNPYKGHHFWKRDIYLLTNRTLPSAETIKLTYHSRARVTLQDNVTKRVIREIAVPIITRNDFSELASDNEIDSVFNHFSSLSD